MNSENTIINHEGRISALEEAVKQICTNHIPHIERDVTILLGEFRKTKGVLIGALVSLVLMLAGLIANLVIGR